MVVDGTDNFETRYLTNDACYFLKKPNVYGSIFRFEGQASVFWPDRGPCYRCLYPEPPPPGLVPSCAEGGVLGILPGVVGSIQATEAIKILLGIGEPLVGRLLLYDALAMTLRRAEAAARPRLPAVRRGPDDPRAPGLPGLLRDRARRGVAEEPVEEITARELKRRLDAGEDLDARRRARAARVGHLPDRRRAPRPAGHARGAPARVRLVAHLRAPLQVAAYARPRRSRSCARPASGACSTSGAASWPGRARSIPRCQPTEARPTDGHGIDAHPQVPAPHLDEAEVVPYKRFIVFSRNVCCGGMMAMRSGPGARRAPRSA